MEPGAITARAVAALLISTWPRRIAFGLILLLPAVVITMGGFAKTDGNTNVVSAGTSVDLGPITVRPISFFVSAQTNRSALEYWDGSDAFLGITADVENNTDEPISLDFPGPASGMAVPVLADGQEQTGFDVPNVVVRSIDGTGGDQLLPGVPDQVVLLWPIADSDTIGDTVTVSMTESIFTYGFVSQEDRWLSIGDELLVDLPRIDLPAALYEPEEQW